MASSWSAPARRWRSSSAAWRALGQVRLFLRHLAQERDLPLDLRAQPLVVYEHGEVAAQRAQERAILRGVAVAATLRSQAEHGHDIPAVAHREEQHGQAPHALHERRRARRLRAQGVGALHRGLIERGRDRGAGGCVVVLPVVRHKQREAEVQHGAQARHDEGASLARRYLREVDAQGEQGGRRVVGVAQEDALGQAREDAAQRRVADGGQHADGGGDELWRPAPARGTGQRGRPSERGDGAEEGQAQREAQGAAAHQAGHAEELVAYDGHADAQRQQRQREDADLAGDKHSPDEYFG